METKNKILIYPLIVMGIVLVFADSCTKDDLITMTKKPIVNRANSDTVDIIVSKITSMGSVSTAVFNPNKTYGAVTDIDSNVYKTITIGTQTWMAENLRATHFSNGDPILNMTDDTEWELLTGPGYCWYDNNETAYKRTYGALYNWYAVASGNLCPTGWHAPSNGEWNTLITYLGGEIAAADKVMEAGNTHWLRIVDEATNESGFTGLPAGFRSIGKDFIGFMNIGYSGLWWSSTEYYPDINALLTQLPSYDDYRDEGHFGFEAGFAARKICGLSVRCVKD
jgi:uncharacterized protein (TIGR02145 family)